MRSEVISEAARKAIENLEKGELKLGSVYPLHHDSNIWKIHYWLGQREIALCLYVFPDFSLEQMTSRIQYRLISFF
jgi:hypothetical protein